MGNRRIWEREKGRSIGDSETKERGEGARERKVKEKGKRR